MTDSRLRTCLHCRKLFVSYGPDNRACAACARKEVEARARPFSIEAERREFLAEFMSIFDNDMVDRQRRSKEHDDKMRRKRQLEIARRKGGK